MNFQCYNFDGRQEQMVSMMSNNESKKSATSDKIVSMQLAAVEFLAGKPAWVLGIYHALRRFLYVAVPVLVWSLLLLFDGILPESLQFGMTLVLIVVLFILSIPISLFQRVDLLLADFGSFTGYSKAAALIFLLFYVLLNFVMIGGLRGLLKGLRGK